MDACNSECLCCSVVVLLPGGSSSPSQGSQRAPRSYILYCGHPHTTTCTIYTTCITRITHYHSLTTPHVYNWTQRQQQASHPGPAIPHRTGSECPPLYYKSIYSTPSGQSHAQRQQDINNIMKQINESSSTTCIRGFSILRHYKKILSEVNYFNCLLLDKPAQGPNRT